ncbi:MAG: BON domain-containing protein [Myxococcota bacterium]|nr:BON domain-containing protein [Myxococcota bacterium]
MRRILRTRAAAIAAAAALGLAPLSVAPAWADMHDPPGEPEEVEVEETETEARIREIVEERLQRNEFIEQYALRAEVEGHEVTLRGIVTAQHEKEKAEEIARGVEGVTGVTNEILVGKLGDEADVGTITQPQPKGRALTGGSGTQ